MAAAHEAGLHRDGVVLKVNLNESIKLRDEAQKKLIRAAATLDLLNQDALASAILDTAHALWLLAQSDIEQRALGRVQEILSVERPE